MEDSNTLVMNQNGAAALGDQEEDVTAMKLKITKVRFVLQGPEAGINMK